MFYHSYQILYYIFCFLKTSFNTKIIYIYFILFISLGLNKTHMALQFKTCIFIGVSLSLLWTDAHICYPFLLIEFFFKQFNMDI